MKKVLCSVIALGALVGCGGYYDYYKSGVRYTQDGADCVYYSGEYGRKYSNEIASLDDEKKIVYRNTRCEDLYLNDNLGQDARHDRRVFVPAARPAPCDGKCVRKKCGGATLQRKYVIVSAD